MNSFEWVKLFLDFFVGISWPVIVVSIVLLLRNNIRELAKSVRSVKLSTDGVEAVLKPMDVGEAEGVDA